MQKTNISSDTLQAHFESASNAAIKGQAQYYTPVPWARALSAALPQYRLAIVDLNCGNGQLLEAARTPSTHHLLGVDIQPAASHVTADVTKFYPLLVQLDWQADLFVLNPPWDLHWYRDRLKSLADSGCPAVRDAFEAHDGRTTRETIDSTVATLCIALDRMSRWGEGMLIGNEATLQRLILGNDGRPGSGAPHAMLAEHCWLHFSIAGNICQPEKGGSADSAFKTGVLYFARDHTAGPRDLGHFGDINGMVRALSDKTLRDFREGAEIKQHTHTEDTADMWKAAAEEWLNLQPDVSKRKWNIWLDADGTIRTDLSLFDQATRNTTPVDKAAAFKLFELNGKHPLALIMQVAQRKELMRATFNSRWRVAPAVGDAVTNALAEYDRIRAPLRELSKIQRLGYLDENDDVMCEKDLHFIPSPVGTGEGQGEGARASRGDVVFKAGMRYGIRTETIRVCRSGTKMNLEGRLDDVEWTGAELAIYLMDGGGNERLFMDSRLRNKDVKLSVQEEGETALDKIDFTLHQLADHFQIPDVPDVSVKQAAEYARHLECLTEIEQLVGGGFAFKKLQKTDYAAAACHDGIILGHDTGCGKGLALFVWPVLKTGYIPNHVAESGASRFSTFAAPRFSLCPADPVLLVAPGDLHTQVMKEGDEKFNATVTQLESQEKFIRLSEINPRTGRRELPPGYYVASYTQLASNGVAPFPPFDAKNVLGMMEMLGLTEQAAVDFFNDRGKLYKRQYERLSADPKMSAGELRTAWQKAREQYKAETWKREVDSDYEVIKHFATPAGAGEFNDLDDDQQAYVLERCVRHHHRACEQSIGETKYYNAKGGANTVKDGVSPRQEGDLKIKCVWSPSLADLCQDTFKVTAIDEGVKIKGEDTAVGQGVRQMNSPFKFVLTATPIKNRLPDIFRLAWWATGAKAAAHARFPYPDSSTAREQFAEEFLISERNLSAEERSEEGRRYVRLTPQVCNVHRLWKMLGPIVLRRRKKEFGEDIVQKHRHVVRVPMGREQAAVYKFHLDAEYIDCNGKPAIGAQLQALRVAAANAASGLLERPMGDGKTSGEPRSKHTYIPKLVACLKLIDQILRRGEQVVVFSAFHDSLDALAARLQESGVRHTVLDGRVSQSRRGIAAAEFKKGPPKCGLRTSAYPVMLAGVECMAEGHSFHLCNNVILLCYSWAYDKFEQAINRVHRLNSRWDVNVYPIICDGSIDRKLEAMVQEKGDAAELVLDGQLLAEDQSEVNLAELLHIAREEFSDGNTIDEATLEVDWPKLRLQLGRAMQGWSTADVADTERITGALEITMTTSAPKPVEEPKPKKQPKQSTEPKAKKTKTKAEAAHADDSDDAFAGMALWVQAKRTK